MWRLTGSVVPAGRRRGARSGGAGAQASAPRRGRGPDGRLAQPPAAREKTGSWRVQRIEPRWCTCTQEVEAGPKTLPRAAATRGRDSQYRRWERRRCLAQEQSNLRKLCFHHSDPTPTVSCNSLAFLTPSRVEAEPGGETGAPLRPTLLGQGTLGYGKQALRSALRAPKLW